MAWLWLPETVHRAQRRHRQSVSLSAGAAARVRSCAASWRSISSTGSRSRSFRRPSRCSRRDGFGFDAPQHRLLLCRLWRARRRDPGRLDSSDRAAPRRQARRSCSASPSARSVWWPARRRIRSRLFALALVPLALGIGFGHPTMASLVSLVAGARRAGARPGCRGRGRKPRAARWVRSGATRRWSTSASRRPTCRRRSCSS